MTKTDDSFTTRMQRTIGGAKSRDRADVAIYAPFAGALYTTPPQGTGGAELQSLYLARALTVEGLRVRHVVFGETPLPPVRDNVEIVALSASYASRGIARRRAVFEGLLAANASVYIQRSAGFETAAVALFARVARRRSIFSSSSEVDFDLRSDTRRVAAAALEETPTLLQYLLGLKLINEVVVQTETQRNLAKTRGISARVIPSFCPPGMYQEVPREFFLWVGAMAEIKNPSAYVELARRVPEAMFWMVATDRGEPWQDLACEVREGAVATPNLRVLSPVARDELLSLYSRAVAVVNTSWFEGFPNTFLEGWARGTPALSLRVDPDSVIERYGLGAVAHGSLDELAAAARALWERRGAIDPSPMRDYIARVHDPAVVGREWAALVRELLGD